MTGFVAWAGAVCMAAAGCTALHMLIGNNGTGKVFRLLTSAFFVLVCLHPLLSGGGLSPPSWDAAAGDLDMDALQAQSLQQMEQATADILLHTVNTALAEHGYQAQKMEIRMDTLEDGRISITNITVVLDHADSLQRVWVKQIAEQRLGTTVDVTVLE